jgi:hypothetical protein
MVGNPRYGRIGLVTMPYFLIFELLSPIVEVFGVAAVLVAWALGAVNTPFALLFGLTAFAYGMLLSFAALAVEEFSFHRYRRWRDLAALAAAAVVENVGFRQLHAWWRLRGLVDALRGGPGAWGTMERRGFTAPAALVPAPALVPAAAPAAMAGADV